MTKWSNRRVLIGCCVNVFLVLLHTGLVISQRQQIAAVRIILHPIIFCCICMVDIMLKMTRDWRELNYIYGLLRHLFLFIGCWMVVMMMHYVLFGTSTSTCWYSTINIKLRRHIWRKDNKEPHTTNIVLSSIACLAKISKQSSLKIQNHYFLQIRSSYLKSFILYNHNIQVSNIAFKFLNSPLLNIKRWQSSH